MELEWDQIVEQHSEMVWRTVTRLVPEQAEAADCFPRTFISAWEFSRKQQIRHWPALLRQLATSRALERRRALGCNRGRHGEFPSEGVIDWRANDPASDAEAMELENHLRSVVGNALLAALSNSSHWRRRRGTKKTLRNARFDEHVRLIS